jgi:predicted MPP superfamily phosphohydrolase
MRVLRYVLGAVSGVLLAILVYGAAIEPRLILDTEEEAATIPDLPAEWAGRTVAAMGDVQVGMWLANEGMVRRAVAEIVERRPAAALLLGDFIYLPEGEPRAQLRDVIALLLPLTAAGIPTYAVLGNHDWEINTPGETRRAATARQTRDALRSAGIVVLHNEAVALPRPGAARGALYVVGIGSDWAEDDAPGAAFGGVPDDAARVVFMHNPNSFAEIPAGAAPLAVAAHTHGGQVRIPGLPEWSWLSYVREDSVHADGWIDGYGAPRNRLYVNRGIGFSLVPLRINCPPEVTFFTLRAGAA